MSSHRKMPPIEEFGRELNEFRKSADVSVERISKITYRSKPRIYKAWCKTELAPWGLIEDVVRAICEACECPEDEEQKTLEYWQRRHRMVEEEIQAGKDAVASLLKELLERFDQHTSRIDRLEETSESLLGEIAELRRNRAPHPDTTLYFGVSRHEGNHSEVLTEIRRHIVLFEQEAERLREESRQAELRAQHLAAHAQQVQAQADELHRHLITLRPPTERPGLPGPNGWQE